VSDLREMFRSRKISFAALEVHSGRYSREARASKETERFRFSRRGLVGGCRRVVADPADRVIAWQHYQAESTSQKNYAADSIGPPARRGRIRARVGRMRESPSLGFKGDRPCDEEK